MRSFIRNIWTQLWLTGVVCLVLLALYTSLGRQFIPLIETMKLDVEQALSLQLGTEVKLEALEGDWIWFSPRVKVLGLSIGDGPNRLTVQRLLAELDVSASLFYQVPVFESIILAGVKLPFVQDEALDWHLASFALAAAPTEPKNSKSFWQGEKPLWLQLLSQQGEVQLYDWQLAFKPFGKPVKEVKLLDLRLRNNGLQHWFDGEVQLAGTEAVLKTQFEVEGDLWDISQHNGKGYVEVASQAWQDWVPDHDSQWQLDKAFAGARLWIEVEQGLLHSLDGYIDIPEFSLSKSNMEETRNLSFKQGRVTLAGRRDGTDWHLWFDSDVQWLSAIAPPKPKGRLSWLPSIEGGLQLALDDIDLEKTAHWLESFKVFEPVYMDYITHLQPQGMVDQVRINLIPQQDWLWGVSLDVEHGSIQSWNGIPAAQQLNAHIQMNARGGVLKIRSSDTFLHFPNLYQEGWLLENAQTEIFWQIEEEYLHLVAPTIRSGFQQAELNGAFSFYTPLNNSSIEPQLHLMLGVENLDLLQQSRVIPSNAIKEISNWINDNIKSGMAKQASFIYSGSVAESPAAASQTIQLYADLQNAGMSYLPGWPEVEDIKANLMVDVPDVDIWIHKASTLGGELEPSSGRVKIRSDKNNQTWLTLAGIMQGSAVEGIQYLQDTPLKEQLGDTFDSWQVAGSMSNELYVHVPLGDTKGSNKIRLASTFDDLELKITDLDLSFSNLTGAIVFDSEKGLTSKNLTAKTFGGETLARISSSKVDEGFDISLKAKGHAQSENIKDWLPLFMLKPVSGELDYDMKLLIRPPARGGLALSMKSNLVGVDIATPAPFGKSAKQAIAFELDINQKRNLRVNFRYGDLANGIIALEDGQVQRGQVYLGTTQAYLPSDMGLSISGNIDHELDMKAWWDLWNDIKPEPEPVASRAKPSAVTKAKKESTILTHIHISAPAVNAWQQSMGASEIVGHHKWGRWQFELNSQMVKGNIILPDDLVNKIIEMDLEYIHMPIQDNDPNKDIAFGSSAALDPLLDFDPKWIPNMDMKVEEVFLGTSNFGRWDVALRQQEKFSQIQVKDALTKSMSLKGDINWSKDANGHKTHLNLLRLSSDNLGDTQRAFRKVAAIEAKKSKFDIDLSWQGSPAGFNYASLNGLAKVNIKDGILISDNAGALKAFGVLNFNSISRRLQLDFSDLYEKGVVFDILKTRLIFKNGIATFADPLWIDGPSAKFQSTGKVNFNSGEIDQKLVVTFPITSSLPLVAVLAGFAPQIAGAIYVTEKLIGEELEQFTSASYTVTGTIENPKMKIDKAFDNELEGKESRSFKNRFLDIFGLGDDDD